jgi:hypothetical protein
VWSVEDQIDRKKEDLAWAVGQRTVRGEKVCVLSHKYVD